jgi:hypothetical protein
MALSLAYKDNKQLLQDTQKKSYCWLNNIARGNGIQQDAKRKTADCCRTPDHLRATTECIDIAILHALHTSMPQGTMEYV